MAEALWSQIAGVDYSAAEDRRLISAIYTNGVINGLGLSAGAGLALVVSAGRAVVPDGTGGAYLCYFDSSTTIPSLPASSTVQVWVTVNTTNGQATLGAGTSLPTTPYITIGSAVTSASAVTTVNNVRTLAASPAGVTPTQYLPITGGSLTGSAVLNATRLTTPAFDATASFLRAPRGVMFGAASGATMRHGCRVYRTGDAAVPNATWQGLRFDSTDRTVSDYGTATSAFPAGGAPTTDGTRFIAPVAGDYAISGNTFFDPNATGTRRARIRVFTNTGAQAWAWNGPVYPGAINRLVTYDTTLHAGGAGWYFVVEVYQDCGGLLAIETGGALSAGTNSWASFRLIQAD